MMFRLITSHRWPYPCVMDGSGDWCCLPANRRAWRAYNWQQLTNTQESPVETKEYRTVDKSTWGPGPWQDEPDKMQWRDEATGLPCLIVRGPSGALCGYVGVAEGHPLYQKDYEHADVTVHGGLTFAGMCADTDDESRHICHVPGPGEPDHVWWFGFDCAHSGDECPAFSHRYGSSGGWDTYKNLSYVRNHVQHLAAQLAS